MKLPPVWCWALALSVAACAASSPRTAAPPPPLPSPAPSSTPATAAPSSGTGDSWTLTILHTNDIHSRIDPVRDGDVEVGGVVRRKAAIDRIRRERGADHVLLLDAGDAVVGTLWYRVWGGSASVVTMNALGYDAVTLGNHELDEGPDVLGRMLAGGSWKVAGAERTMPALQAPVVVSNLDVSRDPSLQGRVVPHAVVTRAGMRIGIVGAETDELNLPLPEKDRLLPYVESVQREVDALTSDGVNAIVLISHCGTATDIANAALLHDVNVIVSGHDHALLGDASALRSGGLSERALKGDRGPYPTHARSKDGHDVPVVSAFEWGQVLGRLDVTFDGAGRVVEAHGAPIVLGESEAGEADPALEKTIDELRAPVSERGAEVLATLPHALVRSDTGQSDLGALFVDSILSAAKPSGAVIALAEGDARTDLPGGALTYGTLYEAWPFTLGIVAIELTGDALTHVVAHALAAHPPLQLAGATVRYAPATGGGDGRIATLQIGGRAVSPTSRYVLAVDSYVAQGGDGFTWLKGAKATSIDIPVEDAVAAELRAHPKRAHSSIGRVIALPGKTE